MIRSLKLKWFEGYKKAELRLSKGVNVILGDSDKGKSSIIRSMELLFRNKPPGRSFINWDLPKGKNTTVSATFENKKTITRNKGKDNNYVLPDGKVLTAISTKVPDSINQISKMKSINIQSQHPKDQYFLLTDSPGQVAKKFNKVAGLSEMDRAITEINSRIRANNSELLVIDKELGDKQKKLKKLNWVKQAHKEAQRIDGVHQKGKKLQSKSELLLKSIRAIEETNIKLKEYAWVDDAFLLLKKIEAKKTQLEKKRSKQLELVEILSQIKKLSKQSKLYNWLSLAQKTLQDLSDLQKKIKLKTKPLDKLESVLNLRQKEFKQYRNVSLETANLHSKFDKLLITTNCPTCGRIGKK